MRGLYYIKNLVNGKKYVGSSENLRVRLNVHKSQLRRCCHPNIHLQRAWDKYGEDNFIFVTKEFPTGCLLRREAKYIKLCGHYNICQIPTASTKGLKMPESHGKAVSHYMTTSGHNTLHKGKIVSSYNLFGERLETYPSMNKAGNKVRDAVTNNWLHDGKQWKLGAAPTIQPHNKAIVMFTDEVTRMFETVQEASTLTGVSEQTIYDNISKNRVGRKRVWRKLKDYANQSL